MSDTPTLPPAATLRTHVDPYCQNNLFIQPRMNHPPSPMPLALSCTHEGPYGLGTQEGELRMPSAQTPWSFRVSKYGKIFQLLNEVASLATRVHQRSSRRKEYFIKGAFRLGRGPDYPTSLRIETVPRLRKVQYSRLGVSTGSHHPPPTELETVSATPKAHTTAQNGMSRESHCPTFIRIDTLSIAQKAQISRAVRPPIRYTEILTAAQTSQHLAWQREQGYDQPPLQQSDEPTLVSVDVRESIGSAR